MQIRGSLGREEAFCTAQRPSRRRGGPFCTDRRPARKKGGLLGGMEVRRPAVAMVHTRDVSFGHFSNSVLSEVQC